MLERTKVVLSKEEYNRLRVKNPELPPLENEELSVKPAKEDYKKVESTWISEDEIFPHKLHYIERWQLLALITLALVGLSFIGYEIHQHWKMTLLIVSVIGLVVWIAILRKRANEY